MHTRSCLLTPLQQHQILDLFSGDEHVALEVTWSAYQNITRRLPRAQHERGQGPDASRNRTYQQRGRPNSLTEIITLGRTLTRRASDILAHFDHPHTTGGPTEAINAPPRTPTRIRPRTCETSPTTSPEHSPKQEDSDPNYTPIMKSPFQNAPPLPSRPS